jgi:hypothetical protein
VYFGQIVQVASEADSPASAARRTAASSYPADFRSEIDLHAELREAGGDDAAVEAD